MKFTVTNYVTVADTSQRHDLARYIHESEMGSYSPDMYSAMTIKSADSGGTMILFSSGNMTAMGSSSRFNSLNRMLDLKHFHNYSCFNTRLTNIVATCHIKSTSIDLGDVYRRWPNFCDYDPDIFPGCTVNVPDSDMKVNLFHSGKVVLSGGTSLKKVGDALAFVKRLL